MKYQNLQFFNNNGYNLNLSVSSLISFKIESYTGYGANLLGVTDSSGKLIDTYSLNKGYMYTNDLDNLNIKLIYALDSSKNKYLNINTNDPSCDASVNFISVNVTNADNQFNTYGINSLSFTNNMNDTYVYPSISIAGNLFMEPISKGLVSTLTLYILEEINTDGSINYITPIDNSKKLVFTLNNDNIKFFNVNNNLEEISWFNKLVFDLNDTTKPINQPIQLNIGFIGTEEGIYEESLNIYIEENGKYSLIGEIIINAECIDEDERFRTLFANFGVPDPISYPHLFKDADINESKIDYNLINKKSKELFLEYSKIFPYVGTYKALINAIKFLGYNDISFREWFLNINEQRYDSYEVSYESTNRANTLLNESIDKRIGLKKLNKLSMIYKINKESGETDNYGIPIVNNVYEYNNEDVLLKLFYLKNWLENNIIGINCRIIDITGEGIYFERYNNIIYSTGNTSFDITNIKSLTPYNIDSESELIDGSANINLSFYEFTNTTINDFIKTPIKSFIDYIYDIDNNEIINEDKYDYYNNKHIVVSAPISIPTLLNSYKFKLSVETVSGTIIKNVNKPIWIYDNEIKFYNYDNHEILFGYNDNNFNYLNLPTIQIEEGYLRDPNSNNWNDSILYHILFDSSEGYYKIIDVKNNVINLISYDYITFTPNENSKLKYTDLNNFNIPLFILNNFNIIAYPKGSNKSLSLNLNDINISNNEFILEIFNGRIVNKETDYKTSYINFKYESGSYEQKISANYTYESDKINFYDIDPIEYYLNNKITVNKILSLNVNNIGKYYIESYAYDNFNNIFYNNIENYYNVYMNQPKIYTYTVQNYTNNSSTFYNENILGDIDRIVPYDYIMELYSDNLYPKFDYSYRIDDITICQASPTGDPFDINVNAKGPLYIKYPSRSYYIDTPKLGDKLNLVNITEECYVDASIDPHLKYIMLNKSNISSQKFNINDNINIIFFDTNAYQPIAEINNKIVDIKNNILFLKDPINNFKNNFVYEAEAPGSSLIAMHNVYMHDNDMNMLPVKWDNIITTYYDEDNNLSYLIKPNIKIFVQNINEYPITYIKNDIINDENVILLEFNSNNYTFLPNQIIKIIYKYEDPSTGEIEYYGSTSFKYIEFKNGYHIIKGEFNKNLINFLLNKYPKIMIDGQIRDSNIYDFIYISYAHQAYVNYELETLYSYEENGFTNVFVNDPKYYCYYLDNTFSIYNLKFKPINAYENWMSYYEDSSENKIPDIIIKEDSSLLNWVYTGILGPNNNYTNLNNVYYRDIGNQFLYKVRYTTIQKYLPIYKYEIPLTIDANIFYINNKHTTYNIILDSVYDASNYIDEKNNIWSIYYNDKTNNTNTLLYEVLNKSLFLSIEKEGIYSINLKTYDKYGNMIEQNKPGFIQL